ncbi:MAG: helix-turn-helix transcriptional regulator [Clostridiales bacterium]|nr:helix-turn-helix transcriptional regulator [Clostridiales bacterium]
MRCDCHDENCPVEATLQLIGGKYKALILWHLLDQTLRFGELRRLIPQATSKMLTQQLRELEESRMLIRTVYPVVPPKVEYALTELGRSIRPILFHMYDWGADYLRGNGIPVHCSMTAGRDPRA